MQDLRGEDAQGEFTKSDPAVSYREKAADVSNQICLAESPDKVKVGKALPKRVDGSKKPAKSDPLAGIAAAENGERVTAGRGEPHAETCSKDSRDVYAQCESATCLKDLRGEDAQGEFTKSDPVVSHRLH